MSATKFKTAEIRAQFPAFTHHPDFVFGDNAGGSQILGTAVERVTEYLTRTNVQMGSDYMPASTSRCMKEAQAEAVKLFNAESPDEIVFGGSSTQNLENLARGLEHDIKEGDEFILTWEHEANNGPWKKLAERTGAIIKYWEPKPIYAANPFSLGMDIEDLLPLVSSKTRLLAITACSNILGSILPVQKIVQSVRERAHEVGTAKLEISLDCVAYAPHRKMDVRLWDIDFCVMSYYKVYGPHVSAMYVRKAALLNSIQSIVHHFLSPGYDHIGYKLQPAGPGYESVWGSTAVVPYIESLTDAGAITAGYEAISAHDAELAEQLLSYLTADKQRRRGVRVVGEEKPGLDRMPTISFVVIEGENGENALRSKEIIDRFDEKGKIGIRYGHFYAFSLIKSIRPDDPSDGVVRISFVHYNDAAEVFKVMDTLDEILH